MFRHTPDRPVSSLDEAAIAPPRRDARVLGGYTLLGRPVDVIETSRGCTFDCSFCSIIEMRGRNFHTYNFDRILDDIRDCRDRGARALFIVDDNITLDVKRFAALCQAIVDAGLHELEYAVQATTASIADHGATLAPLMRQAGFRYVFLGIENVLEDDLGFLKASAKNTKHAKGGRRAGNATLTAIEHLHANGMFVVGGLIVGNPGDTRDAIEANLAFARRYVDWPYIQHPTPYPGTPMTKDLRARGLVINDRLEEYDGTTAVVRSEARARRGDRVPALAGRAVDQAAPLPAGAAPQPAVLPAPRPGDDPPRLPRLVTPHLVRPRPGPRRLRPLPRSAAPPKRESGARNSSIGVRRPIAAAPCGRRGAASAANSAARQGRPRRA